jgi:ABC-type transport system involved in multi-copper enzyme maturation permease subunit
MSDEPEPWLIVPGAAITIALLAWGTLPLASRLIGPLLVYDLGRLARRGRSTLLRTSYAALLTAGLALVSASQFPHALATANIFEPQQLTIAERAAVGWSFVLTVLVMQVLAVLVLTPAYLAGAVAEEKENKTLDMLFTTHLSDREIVLGKLFGRLGHLGMVLLAGMPILTLMLLWGGVHPAVLLAGLVVTAATLLSVGSFSIFCSVVAPNTFLALVISYGAVALFTTCCWVPDSSIHPSPLGLLAQLSSHAGRGAGLLWWFSSSQQTSGMDLWAEVTRLMMIYVAVHGGIATACIIGAVASLRSHLYDSAPMVTPGPHRQIPISMVFNEAQEPRPGLQRDSNLTELYPRPAVDDRPLLWKSMYVGGASFAGPPPAHLLEAQVWSAFVLGLVALSFLAWITAELASCDILAALNILARIALLILLSSWCLGAGMHTAVSLTRERERKTLYGLFTLPVDRIEILQANWLGALLRFRLLGYILAGILLTALVCGAMHPIAFLLVLCSGSALLFLVASLGTWLSLISRNTLWARMSIILFLLVIFAGSWIFANAAESRSGRKSQDPTDWKQNLLESGLNPIRALWLAGFSWAEWNDAIKANDKIFWASVHAAAYGGLLSMTAALVFWRLAVIRFRRL